MRRALVFAAFATTCLFGGCSIVTDTSGFSGGNVGAPEGGPGDAGDSGRIPDGDAQPGDAAAAECNENGLVAFWRMDDGAGTVAKDCTPNALDAPTLKGAPRWVPGHRGGAVELDGDTCFDLGTPQKLTFSTTLSVSLWFYPTMFSSTNNVDYIIGKRSYDAPNGWRIGVRDARPSFEIGVVGNAEATAASRPLAQWSHVAGTYSAGTITLYINGQSTDTRTTDVPTSIVPNATTFRIGCVGGPTADRLMRGRLDDIRVYSRVLTAAEILTLFTEGR